MKHLALTAAITALTFSAAPLADAHCQVPCGIYSDDTVLTDLHTHQETIAKAMAQINTLSQNPGKNANQITRWVINKDEHATKIQDTICHYFLAQRLKLAEATEDKDAYLKKITLAHKIIVLAMKCKQTTDPENSRQLHNAIHAFQKAYAVYTTKQKAKKK